MKHDRFANPLTAGIFATILAFAIFISAEARAAELQNPAGEDAQITEQAEERHNIIGLLLDVGVPDVAGLSLVGRPWRWLRLHFGMTYDIASFGIRGGATYVPFNFFISPSLTIEGGHVFEGDANKITQIFIPDEQIKSLERFSYSYGNGHIGLELGAPNRFLFFIHAGMSYITTQIYDIDDDINDNGGEGAKISNLNPKLSLWVPTAKIGFVLYLF